MKYIWLIILILPLLIGCSIQPEPEILTIHYENYRFIERPVYIYQTIIKTVVIEVEVERTIGIPIELRDFESLKELKKWLGNKCVLLGGDADCDDYASWLQKKGMESGYFISFEAITPGEYNKLFKTRVDKMHAINSVIIGNNFYYIEPQTLEIVLGAYID